MDHPFPKGHYRDDVATYFSHLIKINCAKIYAYQAYLNPKPEAGHFRVFCLSSNK